MSSKLNPRQLGFVENVEKGMSLVDAYMKAGYGCKKSTAYKNASILVRKGKIIEELDNRLFARRRVARQRLAGMVDGATNTYIRILNLKTKDNQGLLALQQKVASDVLDRIGLKPKEEHDVDVSGDGFRIEIVGIDISNFPKNEND